MKKFLIYILLLNFIFISYSLDKNKQEKFIKEIFEKYNLEYKQITKRFEGKEKNKHRDIKIYWHSIHINNDYFVFEFLENDEFYSFQSHYKDNIVFLNEKEKKTIKSDEELLQLTEKVIKDFYNIEIGKKFKFYESSKYNENTQTSINKISFKFSKYYQGYPSIEGIRVTLFLDGRIKEISILRDYYPVMKKFNQTISREKATEIALNALKKEMPVFFEGKYFKYLGRTDTGEVNGKIWLGQTTNFKEPFIMYTYIDYMRDYNKSFIGKLWKKYFPRYPKLIWHINFKFKDERFYKIPGKNYDELMYPTVCIMVNAENGNVEHILPRVFSQFKDGKITSEGRFREK